jgi:hypothetical protein
MDLARDIQLQSWWRCTAESSLLGIINIELIYKLWNVIQVIWEGDSKGQCYIDPSNNIEPP